MDPNQTQDPEKRAPGSRDGCNAAHLAQHSGQGSARFYEKGSVRIR